MNTYSIDIRINTTFANIEAENKKQAIQIVKDDIFEQWGINITDDEIVGIDKYEI
jgi:hypothetical protein